MSQVTAMCTDLLKSSLLPVGQPQKTMMIMMMTMR